MKARFLFTLAVIGMLLFLSAGVSPAMAGGPIPVAANGSPVPHQSADAANLIWKLLNVDGRQEHTYIGMGASITYDLITNTPYISYYNAKTQKLMLASPASNGNCGDGTYWCRNVEPTTTTDDIGQASSIAIHGRVSNVGGKLGMTYNDATTKGLKFAEWSCLISKCDWTFYAFTPGSNGFTSGDQSSLKYNSKGEAQIAYVFNSGLKYCSYVGSSGNEANHTFKCTDVVKNALTSVQYPSLALDPANDAARIAYYDGVNKDLAFAQGGAAGGGTCFSTEWCYPIDTTGDVGKFPSMDIARVNNSAEFSIAYYDATHGKLKHAWMTPYNSNCGPKIGTIYEWKCVVVDNMGTGVNWPSISLVLDSKANPVIAYQDFTKEPFTLKIAQRPSTLGLIIGNCGSDPNVIGAYQCAVVDGGGYGGVNTSEGYYPSLAINNAGLFSIAYQENDTFYDQGTLRLAFQVDLKYRVCLPTISGPM
jgi:hypothetical protein